MSARKALFVVLGLTFLVSMLPSDSVVYRDVRASASNSIYAGGTHPGVVYCHGGGTDWTAISPVLGWSVTSVISFEGTLFASAITDSNIARSSGQVYRYDNTTDAWVLTSTLDDQVTFLIEYKGELYAGTATPARLYKYISATTSWNMVLEYSVWYGFRSAYSWGDWLYLGEWFYDRFARWNGTTLDEFQPECSGSCVYSFEEYGNHLYAGTFIGRIYNLTYEPAAAAVFWGPESHNRFAWSLKAFKDDLYIGFDASTTRSAPLHRYNGTAFNLLWNYSTTTTNYHEGIISMTADDTYLYIGVGGEAVGYPLSMSGEGTGRVYRTSDGSAFELISDSLGIGVQTLYYGPAISVAPPLIYSLVISASPGGTTSPTPGTYQFPAGSVIGIEAIPESGYTFDHWKLNGTNIGSTNPVDLTLDANYALHAVLGREPYDVTIQAYCFDERDPVRVGISMDGGPAIFETPHTFRGIIGTHTFTVSEADLHGHPFYGWMDKWNPKNLTTATIFLGGTYTAYYGTPQPPLVYVEDVISRAGETVKVNIWIKGVSDLFAWTAKLSWDSTCFDLLSAEYGPFLDQGGAACCVPPIYPCYGSMHACISMASTLVGYIPGYPPPYGPPASGVLATITLYVVAPVEGAVLALSDVDLLDSHLMHIESVVQDGEFHFPRRWDMEPQFGIVDAVDMSTVGVNHLRNVSRLTRTPTSWVNVMSPGWFYPHLVLVSDELRACCRNDGNATMWRDFMFNTTGWTGVHKVEVGLETWIDTGTDNVTIALSNDNGTTWSPLDYTYAVDMVKLDEFTWIDVTSAYAWTTADIESIAVKLTYRQVASASFIRIDCLVVAVTPEPLLGPPHVFDPDADVNNDRLVDIIDLTEVAARYGPYGPLVASQVAPAPSPCVSRPTNYSFTPPPPSVKASLPTYAYDGDNSTHAYWRFTTYYTDYGTEDGYFELTAFGPTAGPPRGVTITQVDLTAYFHAVSAFGDGATLNITYVVADSAPVTLWGPVNPAYGGYVLYNASAVEPNDGVWTWEDMSRLRYRFGRADPGFPDSGGALYIYEVWATVHYERVSQLSVNPPTQTASKNFSITINATAIEELYGWEFKLYYNTTVLTATRVTSGPFLNDTAGGMANTFGNIIRIDDDHNATHGLVWTTQTILGDVRGGYLNNGNWGRLATIDFYIDSSGNSTLSVDATLAGHNFAAKKAYSIQHSTTSGAVSVIKLDGDINGDGQVDGVDLTLLASAYGSRPGKPNWNPAADIDQDDLVGIQDLFLLSESFGKAS